MVATETKNLPPGRRRARRLIPAAVVVGILNVGGAWLIFSVQKARNAALSADTT